MYSLFPEDFLDAFFLLSDFAGDLIVDFDVGVGSEIDDLVGVGRVVRAESVCSFELSIGELRFGFLPDVVVVLELVL